MVIFGYFHLYYVFAMYDAKSDPLVHFPEQNNSVARRSFEKSECPNDNKNGFTC